MQASRFGRCSYALAMIWGMAGFTGAVEAQEPHPLARANHQFAVSVLRGLPGEGRNVCFSPANLSASIAMLGAGARGETADQMARVLGLAEMGPQVHSDYHDFLREIDGKNRREAGYLEFISALWGPQGVDVLSSYRETLRHDYAAEFRVLSSPEPVEAAREINEWVVRQTHGRLRQVVAPGSLGPQTRLVLTSVIYFKGSWTARFARDRTWDETFHAPGGEATPAPFMHQSGLFAYWEDEQMQALELPYGDGSIVMDVFLPRGGDGLPGLEAKLSPETLEAWFGRFKKQRVGIALPKFRVLSTRDLREVLSELGMRDAFGESADFSGIAAEAGGLYLSSLIHKAFIEVDEEGAEATAATVPTFSITSVTPSWPTFRADHPFLFLIRDLRSGGILFIGRMARPPAADARRGPLADAARRPESGFVLATTELTIPYPSHDRSARVFGHHERPAPSEVLRIRWSSPGPAPEAIAVELRTARAGHPFEFPVEGTVPLSGDGYEVDLTTFARRLLAHVEGTAPASFRSDSTFSLATPIEVTVRPVPGAGRSPTPGPATRAKGTLKVTFQPSPNP